MARKTIEFGEAVHRVVERALREGARVSNRRRSAGQDEAKRLRVETAARERGDFANKKGAAYTDSDERYMADELYDSDGLGGAYSQHPEVGSQLSSMGSSLTGRSIMEEINEDRMMGKLRPFIEGEPIGVIQHHKRGPAPPLNTPAEIMEDRQVELRERQQRNDRTLDRMIEKAK